MGFLTGPWTKMHLEAAPLFGNATTRESVV